MQESGLNSNHERKVYWESLCRENPSEKITLALADINPTSTQVLTWHYREGKSFLTIKELLNRSISTVRSHHSRGDV